MAGTAPPCRALWARGFHPQGSGRPQRGRDAGPGEVMRDLSRSVYNRPCAAMWRMGRMRLGQASMWQMITVGLWEPGHERENEEKWMNLATTKTLVMARTWGVKKERRGKMTAPFRVRGQAWAHKVMGCLYH